VVDRGPAQPGLLDHVLRVGDAADHPVRRADEHRPVFVELPRELVIGHVGLSSHNSLKPWLVRPSAALVRER
jgi:hypothetical protein